MFKWTIMVSVLSVCNAAVKLLMHRTYVHKSNYLWWCMIRLWYLIIGGWLERRIVVIINVENILFLAYAGMILICHVRPLEVGSCWNYLILQS